MALVLNKKEIAAQAGDGVYAPQPARTFKIDAAVTTAFGPATACKLAGTASTGMPVITPITANTDVVYCVVSNNLRTGSFVGGDHVKAWVADEVVWLAASAAITAGAKVSAATDGTIATQAGSAKVLGIAESSAAAAGDLVAVRLTTPYDLQ